MEIVVLIAAVVGAIGFGIGYSLNGKNQKSEEMRVFIGLLTAVGSILLVAGIAFGACLCTFKM